jgi:hypothetical protein
MSARSFFFPATATLALVAMTSLSGCPSASVVRASSVDSLARLGASPVAREAQRDAPQAYAEFARALAEAESLSGDARAQKVREAELLLAWASTQARVARASARQREADARVEQARGERTRISARVTELDAESEARESATRGLVRTTALPDGPESPEANANELRQQARLALAAAAMMGVSDEQRAAAVTLADEADRATGAARLAAAGRAFREAESLVRAARSSREPSAAELLESTSGGESPVEPRRDGRGVVLTLRALFDGRGALAATATGRLAVVVQALRSHPNLRARVEVFVGGADATRAQRSASDRARIVREALVSRGVDAARIEFEGLARIAGGARSEDVVEVVLLAGG